jgi:hypothetical protein
LGFVLPETLTPKKESGVIGRQEELAAVLQSV